MSCGILVGIESILLKRVLPQRSQRPRMLILNALCTLCIFLCVLSGLYIHSLQINYLYTPIGC